MVSISYSKYNHVSNNFAFDGLHLLNLHDITTHDVMHVQAGTKQYVMNEDSSTLWHYKLGHSSLERVKRLENDGILSYLDFTKFVTCIDCIKEKSTNKLKKDAKKSSTILEFIHSDIYCPDMNSQCKKLFTFLLSQKKVDVSLIKVYTLIDLLLFNRSNCY